MAAVGGAGDAAEEIRVGGEDGFGGFPDGGAVFVKGEFVEDEIAGKSTSGAQVDGKDFDATDLTVDGDAGFADEAVEFDRIGQVVDLEWQEAFG